MRTDHRGLVVLALTVLAGFAVLASTAMLVADAAVARARTPVDTERVEALEERARSDVEAAAELEAERELQTATSLRREVTNRRLGWVLLVSAALFLTGAKWLLGRRDDASLSRSGATGGLPASVRSHDETHWQQAASGTQARDLVTIRRKGARRAPLQESSDQPEPEVDLAVVDDLVRRLGRDREAAIPLLQAIQAHYRYLPDEALRRLCEVTDITPAQVTGTASFYARFRRTPVGEHLVRLCHGTACHVAGVTHVDEELRRQLRVPPGTDTDPHRRFTLEPVACLGCCSLAPVMMVGEETAGHLTPATAGEQLTATVSRLPSSEVTA